MVTIRLRERLRPEVIGVPECPILHRWELVRAFGCKLMLHHFLPESRDRDPHDHPADFLTLVLAGRYDDISYPYDPRMEAGIDRMETEVERMRPGMIRRRLGTHRHVTIAGPRGCWTLVLMLRKRRPWGFWREGRWWAWRAYEERFGHGFRCDSEYRS